MTTVLLITMGLLLLGSAFFSGSETALFSISTPTLRRWKESGTPAQRRAADLMDDHHGTLSAILLGNNFVNLLSALVLLNLLDQLLGGSIHSIAESFNIHDTLAKEIISGLINTMLLLVIGEVTPKALAYSMPDRIAPVVAPFIDALRRAFSCIGLIQSLKRVSTGIINAFGRRDHVTAISPEEYQTFIRLARDMGVFDESEHDLFERVFLLRELNVGQLMIPRRDVLYVDKSCTAKELASQISRCRHRHLPVIDCDLDHVVGVLDVMTFSHLAVEKRDDWLELCVRTPIYLPEFSKANHALVNLRGGDQGMGLVLNEFGGVEGLVTMEDIYEQIVGDLYDEYDEPIWQAAAIGQSSWRVSGHMPLSQVTEQIGIEFGDCESDSIGGYLAEELTHIPSAGETVEHGDWQLTVRRVHRNRVLQIDVNKSSAEEKQP